MQKLSAQLSELAKEAAAVELKAEAIRQESQERIHAQLESARREVKARQDAFAANLAASQDSAKAQWESIGQHFKDELAKIRDDIDAKRQDHNRQQSQHRAVRAERY